MFQSTFLALSQGERKYLANAAGLVQGVTLDTFPAASSIFTSPSEYDRTSARRSRRPAGMALLSFVVAQHQRPRNLWSGGTCRCMLRYAVRRKIAGEEVSTCFASIRRPSK
jgi:hypothetical protein